MTSRTVTANRQERQRAAQPAGCVVCTFAVWHPVTQLSVSTFALYDDARFPGRAILSLNDHYTHLDDVPQNVLAGLTADMTRVSRVLRHGLGADRVNVAVLGNTEPHVHAHVIPRYAERDPLPRRPIWEDPRPWEPLPGLYREALVFRLRSALEDPAG